MHKKVDIDPVVFRAKDRLPINFRDSISIKDTLIDGPDGTRVIGHTLTDGSNSPVILHDVINLVTEVVGIRHNDNFDLPIVFQPNISINSERNLVFHNGTVYSPKLDKVPFVTGGDFDITQWDISVENNNLLSNAGTKGDKGDTGPIGPQGEIGPAGTPGVDGKDGLQGPAGVDGAYAAIGLTGETGATGPQGIQGIQGEKGDKGDTGPKGDIGLQGIAGSAGPAGVPGVNGLTGATGPQGPIGETGATGPQGIQGLVGPTGLTGANGNYGPQGIQGIPGERGDRGDTGPRGDTGLQGIQGIQGEKGDTGAPGADSTVAGPQGPIGYTGYTGPAGPQGVQGEVGPMGPEGPVGPAGAGADGLSAYQVAFINGYTGSEQEWLASLIGPQGIQGEIGQVGATGATGANGLPGTSGRDGIDGKDGLSAYQLAVLNGYVGTEIEWLISLAGQSGPQGETGAMGPAGTGGSLSNAALFNNTSRYQVETTAGQSVWVTSSATVFSGLTWLREATTLTINHPGHGRSIGDRVVVRNTNVKQFSALVLTSTLDAYTVACSDTGLLSGTGGAYSSGFTFNHNANLINISSGILIAPYNCDITLLSMRLHLKANTRASSSYEVVIPASSINGGGDNTDVDSVYLPLHNARSDADTLSAIGSTIYMNQTGSYSTFKINALGAITSGVMILLQF